MMSPNLLQRTGIRENEKEGFNVRFSLLLARTMTTTRYIPLEKAMAPEGDELLAYDVRMETSVFQCSWDFTDEWPIALA